MMRGRHKKCKNKINKHTSYFYFQPEKNNEKNILIKHLILVHKYAFPRLVNSSYGSLIRSDSCGN